MDKNKILGALVEANVLRFGEFTLVSGEKSPIYVDMRVLPSHPESFDTITTALAEVVKGLECDAVAGMETAGIPLSTAIAMKLKKPMVYIRKKPKGYGTGSRVEGHASKGDKLVMVDDLLTRGTSKLDFIRPVKEEGYEVEDVAVILDREQGGEDAMMKANVNLHKLVTLKDLLAYMVEKDFISQEQYSETLVYLSK